MVPLSFSLTMVIEVLHTAIDMRIKPISPGIRKMELLSMGLYQMFGRRSTEGSWAGKAIPLFKSNSPRIFLENFWIIVLEYPMIMLAVLLSEPSIMSCTGVFLPL